MKLHLFLLPGICLSILTSPGFGQSSSFTYQGRLTDMGISVNGSLGLRFSLWDAPKGGRQIGPALTNEPVMAVDGLFTTDLDFGAKSFPGLDRWLEIGLRTSTADAFTVLDPRQALTPVPQAIFASGAGVADSVGSSGVTTASLANNAVTSAKILDGTIAVNDLSSALAAGTFWRLDGNAGLNPATQFLGTTEDTTLTLRAGSSAVLKLAPAGAGYQIVAGNFNAVDPGSSNSVVQGGRRNLIEGNAPESSILGGLDNTIRSIQRAAFIGGGTRNEIKFDNDYALIAGGRDNKIGSNSVISVVVGGAENVIANNVDGGLMVGGYRNDILGSLNPLRRQLAPVLLGGSDNEIGGSSDFTVVLGGDNNRIGTNCPSAVIAGGTNNVIADNAGFSFAAGRRARVNHQGAFVWSDSLNQNASSQGQDTFTVRASGGAFFFSSSGTTGVQLPAGSGSWSSLSDQASKTNFTEVCGREVLERLCNIPVQSWNYIAQDAGIRHLGPVAQDFHTAFGLGEDDQHIATVDADGVALAAIQGLNEKVDAGMQKTQTNLRRLEMENAELRRQNAAMAARLDELEQRLNRWATSGRQAVTSRD